MSATPSNPADVLFGRTRQAVLALLLLRPDERFHLRQVVRLSGAGVGAVQRELAALVGAGLLRREQSGRQVYFQANGESPVFPELQGLILKTAGLTGVLRAALAPVESRIAAAVVFGSMAAGRMHSESDIDLLVVSADLSLRDLAGPIRQASDRLGREVNINLHRPDKWARRAQADHPLARSILSGPRLSIIGGADELERLAEKRLAPPAHPQRRRDAAPARRGGARPPRRG